MKHARAQASDSSPAQRRAGFKDHTATRVAWRTKASWTRSSCGNPAALFLWDFFLGLSARSEHWTSKRAIRTWKRAMYGWASFHSPIAPCWWWRRSGGLFRRHGLSVRLCREPSWANIRDKVDSGALDGAHMLAPMALAAGRGVPGAGIEPVVTALSLGLNGNAITVSRALHRRMLAADPHAMAERPCTARALKAVIEADRRAGGRPSPLPPCSPFRPITINCATG